LKHHTHPEFWKRYERLLAEIKNAADKNFQLLKSNPDHPSLNFKQIGKYWSVRVNIDHRALAIESEDGLIWFWIGGHQEYDKIVSAQKKK
jgi:hypothetical protein